MRYHAQAATLFVLRIRRQLVRLLCSRTDIRGNSRSSDSKVLVVTATFRLPAAGAKSERLYDADAAAAPLKPFAAAAAALR
jgi:hypothetical protein